MTLSEVSKKGGYLATLKALRQKLADSLDESHSGRDIASLALQLQKVLAQIEELEKEQRQHDTLDEIDQAMAAPGAPPVRQRRSYNLDAGDSTEM